MIASNNTIFLYIFFLYFQHKYEGHCNHAMIHKIYIDHKVSLKAHEADALSSLRTGIHDIVQGKTNLKVTIYLDGINPIEITNGEGQNKLVMRFKTNGDIDYKWTEKTLGQNTKDFVKDVASQVASRTIEILTAVVSVGIVNAIEFVGQRAIEWNQ